MVIRRNISHKKILSTWIQKWIICMESTVVENIYAVTGKMKKTSWKYIENLAYILLKVKMDLESTTLTQFHI